MKDSYMFYKDRLNQEYCAVFERVEIYVMTQNVDESAQEERLGELLDIFLSAQDAGKPVQKLTGKNLEQFCVTFCSDFGIRNRLFRVLDLFKTVAWVLVIISAFDILSLFLDSAETGVHIWSSTGSLNIFMYLIAVLISCVLSTAMNMALRRIMFKTKRFSMGVMRTVGLVETGLFFVLIFAMNLNDSGPRCPIWIVLAFSGVYLLSYYLLRGKRIKRQKIKLTDLVHADVQQELTKEMEKRYKKKKGKNDALTFDEFLDSEERSCDRTEKVRIFYRLLPVGVTAVAYLVTWLLEGFETYVDSVIFIAIMLTIEYLILLGLWKVVKNGVAERRAWIKETREKNKK